MKTLFVLFLLSFSSFSFAADCSKLSLVAQNISANHDHIEINHRLDSNLLLSIAEVEPFIWECIMPAFKAKGLFHKYMERDQLIISFDDSDGKEGIGGAYHFDQLEDGRIRTEIEIYVKDTNYLVNIDTLVHEIAHAWETPIRFGLLDGKKPLNWFCKLNNYFRKVDSSNRFNVSSLPTSSLNYRNELRSNTLKNYRNADRPSVYSNVSDGEFMAEAITAMILNDAWATQEHVEYLFDRWNHCRDVNSK